MTVIRSDVKVSGPEGQYLGASTIGSGRREVYSPSVGTGFGLETP